MPDPKAFPDSLVDLTPEWLTGALRRAGCLVSTHVTSVESTPLGDGRGLMSHMARLRLSYDAPAHGAPDSLIVKLPPESESSRSVGVQLGFFEREARFYTELATRTAIRVPRCYFSRYEPADGSFLTLLEDLSYARFGDAEGACSIDDGTAAMGALARLHASWWNSAQLAELPWLPTRAEHLAAMLGLVDEAWPTFVSRFESTLDDGAMQVLTRCPDILNTAQGALSSGSFTLLHGDYKLDNLFFTDEGEVLAFDWGLVMAGPPAFDVAFFIGLNLEPVQRTRHERQLIRTYVDVLAANGVNGYPFDRCVADYRVQLAGLLPQLIGAGGLATFAGGEAMQRYATGLRRVLAAVMDHRVLEELQFNG